MATTIQVKRSTVTNSPTNGSLATGEPAYSYSSNIMFMGTSDGAGVLAIGGKFYVDKTNSAYSTAISAYDKANSANLLAYESGITGSAAYDKANSANVLAYDTNIIAYSAFNKANSANYFAYLVNANTVAAFDKANTGTVAAANAFDTANLAFAAGNAAFDTANSAQAIAIAGYDNSNTKFSSSGGSITGNVAITGTLTVTGNVYSQDTETLRVSDPLIYLAGNNYTSDIVDIGFIANYVNATGSNVHTGLYREHETKEYYLFQGYDAEPMNNHIGALSNNMTLSVLNADLKTSNLVLGGQNTITWITSAFGTANLALDAASAGFNLANLVEGIATAAFNQSNSNYDIAVASYNTTNTVSTVASAAFDKANSANSLAYDSIIIASAAFDTANASSGGSSNASLIDTGTLAVAYGGTGGSTFTLNGILYGNTAGPLKVTSAGTEGQVLQADASGVPTFGMLDGGSF